MKTNISKIHLEILDEQRLKLLDELILLAEDCVLSGGTALSLQIKHRKSFDFDFFSNKPIAPGLARNISSKISIGSISVDTSDELTFFTSGKIKVTFLYYPFRNRYGLLVAHKGLKLYSIKDIALQKAYTVGRRGEYRDYFDLYTILKKGYLDLEELVKSTESVYKELFNPKIFFQQLVYFDDLLNFEIIAMGDNLLPKPEEVKSYFEELVRKYINS